MAGDNVVKIEAFGDYADLTMKLRGWYKQDITKVLEWRKQAREDYQFYSGDQWSEEDQNALREKNRPALVFNRVAPLVNAVVGSEINNRREVQYIPREQGDSQANEVLTAAGEWFRDQTSAEDEESDAFEDAVICGMGWTDTRLDFETDQDGIPKVTRLDPLKMVWDSNAVKPNLEDANRLWYIDDKPISEAMELFPNVDPSMLNASWVRSMGDESPEPHDQDRADLYEGGQNVGVDWTKKTCTIVECRWFEKVPYYRGPDIENPGQMREYDERQIALLRKQFGDFPAVRQTKKVVKRAFIGREVLAEPDQPLAPPGMFGWECITGYRDKIKALFYGVVRTTKDPQRWSNKFFSQVMFLLNSQSKGGVIMERGAVDDDTQFEKSWAKSEDVTYVKNGALGQYPKLQPKPVAQFPAGFFTLFQESKEAINQVTGLSPEFIGTREVDQAGVLEYQRRQSSLNLLASLFNSLRRYRKRQGKVMLYLIQNYLSDGRLIRIVGKGKAEYLPLTKPENANLEYDIIVDDAPTSPNEKQRTWEIMQPMLPLIFDQIKSGLVPPTIILDILAYSPLPASMVDALRKAAEEMAAQAAQQPKQPSPEEIQAQQEQQRFELEMAGKQMDLETDQKKAEIDTSMKLLDAFIKGQQAQNDLAIDEAKTRNEAVRLANQAQSNAIKQQRANNNRISSAD